MTADVDLLPLPNPTHPTHTLGPLWSAEQMQAYARANVAHATAVKDAEIEALRAENERLRDGARVTEAWPGYVRTALRVIEQSSRELAVHAHTLRDHIAALAARERGAS